MYIHLKFFAQSISKTQQHKHRYNWLVYLLPIHSPTQEGTIFSATYPLIILCYEISSNDMILCWTIYISSYTVNFCNNNVICHFKVVYQDWGQVLCVSDTALDELNQKLEDPVEMRNFRPNFTINGCPPHDEVVDFYPYEPVPDLGPLTWITSPKTSALRLWLG